MESPRKFNDCYFYYYSTCTKGDNCVFRHEPSALGCEQMCSLWQQGKCLDKRCKLRHMELRKNRKQIPCYWENQPGGCRKKHCPFMHKNPDARSDGIMPSQPGQPNYENPQSVCSVPDTVSAEGLVPTVSAVPGVPVQGVPVPGVPGVPGVAPVPLLWQQQRQVVLDSGILGVLPNSPELALRRHEPPPYPHPLPHHPHPHQHPLPVDPLVVKFEEESDGETPSSTPTKAEGGAGRASSPPGAPAGPASPASQELLLLERIQAEAAAYYNYSDLPTPPAPTTHVRANLSTKYDRLSLDELTGRKPPEAKNNLDFKIMSLDEIRAKKRHSAESLNAHPNPITLNLNRKRKLSSQETIIDSNNKIIKLVRSNSIVYKKLDGETKKDKENRKRTMSEQSDVLEIQADELVDDCHTFKKVKIDELTNQTKPTLIRTKTRSESKVENDDSDSEVQIVCEKICYNAKRTGDIENTIEIVDLSDEEDDVILTDLELGLGKSVPDVVASCQSSGEKMLDEIDALLTDEL